jgi:hypothetical protein
VIARRVVFALASAVAAVLLAGCGGGDDSAKVEANLRQYLNTLDPRPSGFPVGAARVKENSCKKIPKGQTVPVRRPRASWSCVVRFGHTPFRVLVALKDSGGVAWVKPLPRHALQPQP